MNNNIVSFIRQKDYKLQEHLGQGGLGKTVLLLDQEVDEYFVCKKYSPREESIKKEYYDYFKNEIKVMYRLNHLNIVRIFNYYLYPEQTTGFILMEYIKGKNVYEYLIENPSAINKIFEQIVDAFLYLESQRVLHRDIRKENILVDEGGIVKVIDFGFGKQILTESDKEKSISLNWWCGTPKEFGEDKYESYTDLYFIGKLFEEILALEQEGQISFDFSYEPVVKKMCEYDPVSRYKGFSEMREDMHELITDYDYLFDYDEKETYQMFVEYLVSSISEIDNETKYNTDLDRIINGLEKVYKENILENMIQNTRDVTRVFLNGSYRFYNRPVFRCENFKDMIKMLKNARGGEKANILLLNIFNRLNQVQRISTEYEDDIPF